MQEYEMKPLLLDCTLRDGGYVNDWAFGHDNIINIFERLVAAGVDFIEVGFLDDSRAFDLNRTIMPDTCSVERIFGRLDRKNTQVLGMILYGTCDVSRLQPCVDSWLDGIRVIFKKDKMYPAMEFCRQVKALGYKVFSQLVSVTSYCDEELLEITRLANDVKPYALSMVDTYGLMNPEELKHIAGILDTNLDPEIILGFHAHNNFQLGYINTTTALNLPTKRGIIVDGTLYGMGKSAGNAPLELVAMYMNEHCGENYVITEMQEAITTSVMDFQKKSPWGYQLIYYIAASNRVHPNYVQYLMNKRTLSITAINEILHRLPEEQKLEKNLKLIEQLYIDYQKKECDDDDDLRRLGNELSDHKILVIGPGASIGSHREEIQRYIDRETPVIIAINYIPQFFRPDYLFFSNSKRYIQSATKLHEEKNQSIRLIASSNLTRLERDFDYVINYSNVIDESAEFPDNSMCMLIRILLRCGCENIALAGFDGYTPDNMNYYEEDKAYSFLKEKANGLNAYARNFFRGIKDRAKITFVTPSEYQRCE